MTVFILAIELAAGRWIVSEKVQVTDAAILFKRMSGILAARHRDEVRSIQKTIPDD